MVTPLGRSFGIEVGPELLGRVLNGLGQPIDGGPKLRNTERVSLTSEPPNPLQRQMINEPLETGVRAIDGLLTIGRGQRVGIFAGSGVGKSTLLGMIARQAKSDVNVIALLGERGREVAAGGGADHADAIRVEPIAAGEASDHAQRARGVLQHDRMAVTVGA